MKDLLYYIDSTTQKFPTQLLHIGNDGRDYVVLANTAFYPTGGGQPHDTGWLNDVEVVDVEKIDGEIRHYINGELTLGKVTGKLNWQRRFDHMQQHTGQHILTAAFAELFDYATTSFHLGTGFVSIDLNTEDISEEQLQQAEVRANEIILENRPIETKWLTKDELAAYNLRKDVAVDEDIRLVIIPDYDYNGCGGTHPTSTGQVSLLKIMATEKMKKQIRVHFVCGQRVLQELAMRKTVLADVARQLSVPEEQAATALKKVMDTAKATDKNLAEVQEALLQYEAIELLANAQQHIVSTHFENRPIQDLQKLGRFITKQDAKAIALLAAHNDDKLQFVAARGENVTVSMKHVAKAVLPIINGKGGGSDALVQGGGEQAISGAELLQHMENALKQ
ncbi:DHHA1 domain-containing protein [Metasolibacillus meyeri]|uniref:DHHA1 domain-containing protein n=1 Tax=Metasolibacillus meyeri TaxID=1071052 RepID=A0AAW9NZI8_9BACL|nr:DHHA1 domain-containing protein [Metasolibacillus meyeri]MEC1180775.1 DHHA1 domain-containing protein [Metasolibacillus meyeri]